MLGNKYYHTFIGDLAGRSSDSEPPKWIRSDLVEYKSPDNDDDIMIKDEVCAWSWCSWLVRWVEFWRDFYKFSHWQKRQKSCLLALRVSTKSEIFSKKKLKGNFLAFFARGKFVKICLKILSAHQSAAVWPCPDSAFWNGIILVVGRFAFIEIQSDLLTEAHCQSCALPDR